MFTNLQAHKTFRSRPSGRAINTHLPKDSVISPITPRPQLPVSELLSTFLVGLKSNGSLPEQTAKRSTARPVGAKATGVMVRLLAVDSNGKMTKEKVLLDSQQALDRVLDMKHSQGLISLNNPTEPQPSAAASLEELQYNCEYVFHGDEETLNSLRRMKNSAQQAPRGAVAVVGELDVLSSRLATLYPHAIPRPDLCSVLPAPHEPHHDAPLAGQSYSLALEIRPEGSAGAGSSSSSSNSNQPSQSSISNGNVSSDNGNSSKQEGGSAVKAASSNGTSAAASSSNSRTNGSSSKSKAVAPRSSLILGKYVAWLDGDHVDEAHKRIMALRRRAAQPTEWPSYAKYGEFEHISLVMFGHKIAEGEEDRVECLSSLYGVRLILEENGLDVCPPNFLKT